MTGRRSQRGSGLLVAFVVVMVLTVIAVALTRLSRRELAGATAARQSDKILACAEAGRLLLQSQFRALGITPDKLTAFNSTMGDVSLVGGHVDSDTAHIKVDQVKVLPPSTVRATNKFSGDITNIVAGTVPPGGLPYRVMVHCVSDQTGDNRQLEIEFGVQFGL